MTTKLIFLIYIYLFIIIIYYYYLLYLYLFCLIIIWLIFKWIWYIYDKNNRGDPNVLLNKMINTSVYIMNCDCHYCSVGCIKNLLNLKLFRKSEWARLSKSDWTIEYAWDENLVNTISFFANQTCHLHCCVKIWLSHNYYLILCSEHARCNISSHSEQHNTPPLQSHPGVLLLQLLCADSATCVSCLPQDMLYPPLIPFQWISRS